jgi:lysophospholipid acyltransferase (LPLAT)-like uncharacterized protein
VPKPFATVTVTYSQPEFVRADSARDATQELPKFEAMLRALAERS